MITSTSNARVKELVQLQKKSKVRNEQGVFLVEGVKMYQEIPQEQLVKSMYPRHLQTNRKKKSTG